MGDKKHTRNVFKTPLSKIKILKQEIDTFQTQVGDLLECIGTKSLDNICISCNSSTLECEDLPCQHMICRICYNNQIKNKRMVVCPVCQKTHQYPLHSIDSFSSEEN